MIPAASEALKLTRYTPYASRPGHSLAGLANLAFLHEQFMDQSTAQAVLDATEQGRVELLRMAEAEARRRRNPLYWLDRALRLVLGLVPYLVSLITGVPRGRVESRPWGPVLRLASLAAEIVGSIAAGRALGWW